MITLAEAKSELVTARICRKRWVDMFQITGKTKYFRLCNEALECVGYYRWLVNKIEKTVLIAQQEREVKMKEFYFTWGFGQGHDNCYTIIKANDMAEARKIMFELWGKNWFTGYESAEKAGVERFNLQMIN